MEAFMRCFKAVCAFKSEASRSAAQQPQSQSQKNISYFYKSQNRMKWMKRWMREEELKGMRNEGTKTRWGGRAKRWPMRLEGMNLDDGGNTVTDAWTDAMKDRCLWWREDGGKQGTEMLLVTSQERWSRRREREFISLRIFFSCISPLDGLQIHQKAQPSSETLN